ncbi:MULTISPECIES: GNAT family N-acetyltransferase [unclassified Bradyrhizobium]|uniref:GNAT family N-acetyltransferase n=1 Tax=unclassified Bradyrhizobium TaxID=2631580 RepID=UPI001FFB1106|nr:MULTISPECIES: GNAT family N-acetyltransferase [unclassified Bradyrhizobium]MCK1724654.1 GNAT family N-acetyltransferase [Bradyrhizobium sp. 142]
MPLWFNPHHSDPDIRQLDIGQLPSVQAFLSRLDAETRCRRFGAPLSDAALDLHAITALENAELMLGIFSEQRLRGMLELYRQGGSRVMELLIVVEGASRRRGMGRHLLNASMLQALDMDARSVDLIYTSDNWPMRRLAQRAGARIDLAFGTFRARIDLAQKPIITRHLRIPIADDLPEIKGQRGRQI